MASAFSDTLFAYIVRSVLGPQYFPHVDEISPSLWQEKALTQTTPRDSAHTTLNDPTEFADGQQKQKIDTEKGNEEPLIVGWYGPTDPENPHNWSRNKKLWVLFQTCLLEFTIYAAGAIYTAGIPSIKEEFHVGDVAATIGLTLFIAGYGIGPMLLSTMSEIPQIGRMPIYVITLALFILLQIPTALATNYGMLMAFRFITGFVGSPIIATGGASVADIYNAKKRPYGITLWGVFAASAPSLGPLLGSFSSHIKGWRWTMWESMWMASGTFVVLFFFYPETAANTILQRRAARLRKATGNPMIKSASEIAAASMTFKGLANFVLVAPFVLNFQEPIIFVFNLYIGLIYALLYIWFESFPLVFIGIYHWREQMLGLAYLGLFVGTFVFLPPFFSYLYFVQEKQYNDKLELHPENRMPIAIVGGLIVPICLFWFGWTSRASVHWIVPIIGSGLFNMAMLLLFNAVLNYLTDSYPAHAASVLAGNGLIRSMFGASFPLFARAMYVNLGVGWASTLLALLGCLFAPIPMLLWKYGERIRHASKRARHDI